MEYDRPIVLTIAGYDPTGGAGVLADVKTFEQHNCLGMAVITATTIQTEKECMQVEWQTIHQIKNALTPLLERYAIYWVKIGLIENIDVLIQVCHFIKTKKPHAHIIWDSVLAATSGFSFIETWKASELKALYAMLYLLTPNAEEMKLLTKINDEYKAAASISAYCPVLLKGGHSRLNKGDDLLFYETITSYKNSQTAMNNSPMVASSPLKINKKILIKSGTTTFYDKHGTGCILSSAITANLALGFPLEKACKQAKLYIEKLANSNKNRLAYHNDTTK